MPIYEYECTKCGHHLEVWQKFSDQPITWCEKCRGGMKKLISQSSFHLKGTGWYVTDYASNRGGSAGKRETSHGDTPTKKESKGSSETPKKESKASSETPKKESND